jgi:MFS family permease
VTTESLTSRPVRSPAAPAPALSGLGLFTVLLAAALPLIDFFIVNVALPTIGTDLAASESVLELVVAGYGVSYAVLLVLGGRLGDLFGRRRLFLVGMAAFGLTSLACGLAPGAWSLVAARVAQGASAAAMLPQVLATIQATTTGPRRAKAMGLYGATAGLSMVAGQILGGVLVAADIAGTGWRSVFLVNVPVVLAGLFLAARAVPETRSTRPEPVDVPGTFLLAASILTLLVPLTEGRAAGWPLWTWLSLAAAPPLLAAFVRRQRRLAASGRVPLLDLAVFGEKGFAPGLVAVGLLFGTSAGLSFVLALYLQDGLGLGPLAAGAVCTALNAGFFAGSLRPSRLGAPVLVLGLGLLHWAVGAGPVPIGAALLVTGAGMGLLMSPLLSSVLAAVRPERSGAAAGVLGTVQEAGGVLGGTVTGAVFFGALDGGWEAAARAALVALLVGALGVLAHAASRTPVRPLAAFHVKPGLKR